MESGGRGFTRNPRDWQGCRIPAGDWCLQSNHRLEQGGSRETHRACQNCSPDFPLPTLLTQRRAEGDRGPRRLRLWRPFWKEKSILPVGDFSSQKGTLVSERLGFLLRQEKNIGDSGPLKEGQRRWLSRSIWPLVTCHARAGTSPGCQLPPSCLLPTGILPAQDKRTLRATCPNS